MKFVAAAAAAAARNIPAFVTRTATTRNTLLFDPNGRRSSGSGSVGLNRVRFFFSSNKTYTKMRYFCVCARTRVYMYKGGGHAITFSFLTAKMKNQNACIFYRLEYTYTF